MRRSIAAPPAVTPRSFVWPLTQLHKPGLLALFVLLVLVLLLTLAPARAPISIDVGAEGAFRAAGETAQVRNMFGFYAAEQDAQRTFRWTEQWARLILTGVRSNRQRLELQLSLCGCRPADPPVPVELRLDQQLVATLPAGQQFRRYTVLVPPDLQRIDADLFVELESPVQEVGGRSLGVMVDSLQLRAHGPATLPPLTGLSLALGALLAAALVLWRLPISAALAALLVLLAGLALLLLIDLPQDLPLAALLAASIAATAMLGLLRPQSAWISAGLSFTLVGMVWLPGLLGGWMVDDAFISFRYAQQLVAGHGLVFNPGERVEGYTNFLWTILISAVMRAGGDPLLAARCLNLLFAQATVALVYAVGRRILPPAAERSGLTLIAPLLLASSAPFALYGARGGGLETPLFACLLLAAVLAYLSERLALSGLLLALATMTRPEGAMLLVLSVVHCSYRARAPEWWRGPAVLSGVYLLLYLPYYLWRFSYYGLPLPNTFYVKVGNSSAQFWRGLDYLAEYWRTEGWAWLLGGMLLLMLGLFDWRKRQLSQAAGAVPGPVPVHMRSRPGLLSLLRTGLQHVLAWNWPRGASAYLALLALVYSAYIVAVGGDWMPGARFVVPIIALLSLLAQLGLARLAASGRAGVVLVVLLLGLALLDHVRANLALHAADPANRVWNENYVVARRREVGLWLAANTPADALVAVEAAGALPYYSQRPAIDILGLNDRHIASLEVELGSGKPGHEKTDIPYVLDRKPAIIPYFSAPYFEDQPRFATEYRRVDYRGPEGRGVVLYRRVTP